MSSDVLNPNRHNNSYKQSAWRLWIRNKLPIKSNGAVWFMKNSQDFITIFMMKNDLKICLARFWKLIVNECTGKCFSFFFYKTENNKIMSLSFSRIFTSAGRKHQGALFLLRLWWRLRQENKKHPASIEQRIGQLRVAETPLSFVLHRTGLRWDVNWVVEVLGTMLCRIV